MRTAYLDPDFRKDPISKFFCCRCQKTLVGKKCRWVYLKDSFTVVHPDDIEGVIDDLGEPIKAYPIGLTCTKTVGLHFTFKK